MRSGINYPAVRAFLRASREMYQRHFVAWEADHAVCPDGYGAEWLHAKHRAEEFRMAMRIGKRFGLGANQLIDQVWLAANMLDARTMAACMARTMGAAEEHEDVRYVLGLHDLRGAMQ